MIMEEKEVHLMGFLQDFNLGDPPVVLGVIMGLTIVAWLLALFLDQPPR